jgi:hypothetical protein
VLAAAGLPGLKAPLARALSESAVVAPLRAILADPFVQTHLPQLLYQHLHGAAWSTYEMSTGIVGFYWSTALCLPYHKSCDGKLRVNTEEPQH